MTHQDFQETVKHAYETGQTHWTECTKEVYNYFDCSHLHQDDEAGEGRFCQLFSSKTKGPDALVYAFFKGSQGRYFGRLMKYSEYQLNLPRDTAYKEVYQGHSLNRARLLIHMSSGMLRHRTAEGLTHTITMNEKGEVTYIMQTANHRELFRKEDIETNDLPGLIRAFGMEEALFTRIEAANNEMRSYQTKELIQAYANLTELAARYGFDFDLAIDRMSPAVVKQFGDYLDQETRISAGKARFMYDTDEGNSIHLISKKQQ